MFSVTPFVKRSTQYSGYEEKMSDFVFRIKDVTLKAIFVCFLCLHEPVVLIMTCHFLRPHECSSLSILLQN